MAIKDFIRPPSGQIRAPHLANYGDALSPLANHIQRLVDARDKKEEAQKQMDFQRERDKARQDFESGMQDSRQAFQVKQQDAEIQANIDAATEKQKNHVINAKTEHGYDLENNRVNYKNQVKLKGIAHGYDLENRKIDYKNEVNLKGIEHGYDLENKRINYKNEVNLSGINHGYRIDEINANATKQRKLKNLVLENDEKFAKFKSKLQEEDNKAYSKYLEPSIVYSKPNKVATEEVTSKAQAISKPKYEKLSKSFYDNINSVSKKLGMSYDDYNTNKDKAETLMSSTGLSIKDFKGTKGSYTTKFGSVVDLSKPSKAEDVVSSLTDSINSDSKKLEILAKKGLTYRDASFRKIKDNIDNNTNRVNNINKLIDNPKLIEVVKASKVFKPIESKFNKSKESIKKDAFRSIGIKDYKNLPTDSNPHIDYEATIDRKSKNLREAMANGAPKNIISFLQNDLNRIQKVNINAQKQVVSKNNTQQNIIKNTRISNINESISSARGELKAINTQRAKDGGSISEENKKRILDLKREIKKLNAEKASEKMN